MKYLEKMEEYNRSIGSSGVMLLRIIGLTFFIVLLCTIIL